MCKTSSAHPHVLENSGLENCKVILQIKNSKKAKM
jgi:hypothetical protein